MLCQKKTNTNCICYRQVKKKMDFLVSWHQTHWILMHYGKLHKVNFPEYPAGTILIKLSTFPEILLKIISSDSQPCKPIFCHSRHVMFINWASVTVRIVFQLKNKLSRLLSSFLWNVPDSCKHLVNHLGFSSLGPIFLKGGRKLFRKKVSNIKKARMFRNSMADLIWKRQYRWWFDVKR